MKNLIAILLFVTLSATFVNAQNQIAEIWTAPAAFKADEQVTWYFDLTGTQLEGTTETVYMWAWFPSEPDAGNWNNSSDFAALTLVEGNVWKIALTPTEYFSKAAADIFAFYGLLKNKDGSKVTDAFAPETETHIKVGSFTKIATTVMDYYPQQFKQNRPLSILINANNTYSNCNTTAVKGKLAEATSVHAHAGINNWDKVVENNADNQEKNKLTHLGGGIYRLDIILNDYFGVTDDYRIEFINLVLANADWSLSGQDAGCADILITAPGIEEPLPPELIFFPQKISQRDILCIFRRNNEKGATLKYEITAGSKTITGDFAGTITEFVAYIDLATELKNEGKLEKIHVLIKNSRDKVISDLDIPLVQPNE